jgi:hypothetical protein
LLAGYDASHLAITGRTVGALDERVLTEVCTSRMKLGIRATCGRGS